MLKANKDKLPVLKVQGQVSHPKASSYGRMTTDGSIVYVPGSGGITLNAQIGDICTGWAADHLEPGVSTRHPDDESNDAYTIYSCIGNEATVISGDAKGGKGYVVGKHGGREHTMLWFPDEVLEQLESDDKVSVRSQGQGMALSDYPDILLRSMSPLLLERMNITEAEGGKVRIGVAKVIPACIMGSGLGSLDSARGDCDITLHDPVMVAEHGLTDLRFGDIVAITDADSRFGRTFRTGAVTIGVIIHADSVLGGHGPGVTTLMSSKTPCIEPIIDKNANLKTLLRI